jgi:hypothetical protein
MAIEEEKASIPPDKKRKPVGYVNIESGSLAILDQRAVGLCARSHATDVSPLMDGEVNIGKHLYYAGTRTHIPMAVLLFEALGGDGCFPVYVERREDEFGHVIHRILIEVEHGPKDEDEWQKRVKGEIP